MTRLIFLLLASMMASYASAQSLAEIAKKERERREKLDQPKSETITERDLRTAGGALVESTVTVPGEEEEESDSTEGSTAEEPEQDERGTRAEWQARIQAVDDRIARLEQQLNSPLYTNNPTGGGMMDRQRLERQLAEARQERNAILAEARRKNVPPGWLR